MKRQIRLKSPREKVAVKQGFKSIAEMRRFIGLSTDRSMVNRIDTCLEGIGDTDELFRPPYWTFINSAESEVSREFGFLLTHKAGELGITRSALTNRLNHVRNGQRDMKWALKAGHHKRGGSGYQHKETGYRPVRGNAEWNALGDVER